MLSTNFWPYGVYLLFYTESRHQASTMFNPVTDTVESHIIEINEKSGVVIALSLH